MEQTLTKKNGGERQLEKHTYIKPYYTVDTRDDEWLVRMAMPGVNKSGVDISLEEGCLTVTGTRVNTPEESWKIISREIPNEDYRLALQLNVDVNEDAISAKMEDGILTLRLPKAEEAKPRSITVE